MRLHCCPCLRKFFLSLHCRLEQPKQPCQAFTWHHSSSLNPISIKPESLNCIWKQYNEQVLLAIVESLSYLFKSHKSQDNWSISSVCVSWPFQYDVWRKVDTFPITALIIYGTGKKRKTVALKKIFFEYNSNPL